MNIEACAIRVGYPGCVSQRTRHITLGVFGNRTVAEIARSIRTVNRSSGFRYPMNFAYVCGMTYYSGE